MVLQALRRDAAGRGAAARAAVRRRPRSRCWPGTADVESRARPRAALAAAAPVGGRGADDRAAVRHLALPRSGLGGRALPVRGLRRGAGGRRAPGRRALVPPAGARARAGRAAAAAAARPPSSSPGSPGAPAGATASAATGTSTGTCGTMLAQLLAAADSAGLEPAALHPLPGPSRHRARRRRRRARVAGGGRRAGEASRRSRRPGRPAGGEVDAAPGRVPARHCARSGPAKAKTLGEPWARGAPVEVPEQGTEPVETVVLSRSSQRRHGPGTRACPRASPAARSRWRCAASSSPTSSSCTRSTGSSRASTAGRTSNAPVRAGNLRRRALPRRPRPGPPARRGVRRDRHRRRRARSTTASTARRSSPRGSSRGDCTWRAYALGAGASGMTFLDSEIPALRRRAAGRPALHLRRRARVQAEARRPPRRAAGDQAGDAAAGRRRDLAVLQRVQPDREGSH